MKKNTWSHQWCKKKNKKTWKNISSEKQEGIETSFILMCCRRLRYWSKREVRGRWIERNTPNQESHVRNVNLQLSHGGNNCFQQGDSKILCSKDTATLKLRGNRTTMRIAKTTSGRSGVEPGTAVPTWTPAPVRPTWEKRQRKAKASLWPLGDVWGQCGTQSDIVSSGKTHSIQNCHRESECWQSSRTHAHQGNNKSPEHTAPHFRPKQFHRGKLTPASPVAPMQGH